MYSLHQWDGEILVELHRVQQEHQHMEQVEVVEHLQLVQLAPLVVVLMEDLELE